MIKVIHDTKGEIDFDQVWHHGPPEENLISTWKGGSGDYYRTIWRITKKESKTYYVRDF